jgi:hypothetical protein
MKIAQQEAMMKDEKNQTMSVTKTFFAWQEEKEAKWLESMANQGWILTDLTFFHYTFTRAEPQECRYAMDFFIMSKKDVPEYIQMFEDAGWIHCASMGNWYYFRSSSEAVTEDIFTDRESRIVKYRRILLVLAVVSIPLIHQLVIYPQLYLEGDRGIDGFYRFFLPFTALVLALLILAAIRIMIHIRRIQKKYPKD